MSIFSINTLQLIPRVQWIMALEKSVQISRDIYLRHDGSISPQRQNRRIQPIAIAVGWGDPHIFKGMMHRTSVIGALANV